MQSWGGWGRRSGGQGWALRAPRLLPRCHRWSGCGCAPDPHPRGPAGFVPEEEVRLHVVWGWPLRDRRPARKPAACASPSAAPLSFPGTGSTRSRKRPRTWHSGEQRPRKLVASGSLCVCCSLTGQRTGPLRTHCPELVPRVSSCLTSKAFHSFLHSFLYSSAFH